MPRFVPASGRPAAAASCPSAPAGWLAAPHTALHPHPHVAARSDWRRAPNHVAKRYKKPVERDVYFGDVVLQMDAKYLGEGCWIAGRCSAGLLSWQLALALLPGASYGVGTSAPTRAAMQALMHARALALPCPPSPPWVPPPSQGDEYNKTRPPKKVDFMQAAVVEFRDRPGKPVMCVEHLIQGDYIKARVNPRLSPATVQCSCAESAAGTRC